MKILRDFQAIKLKRIFQNTDPISRITYIGLGITSTVLFLIVISNLLNRIFAPKIIIAAGDVQGESYIISKAIEKVVEDESNISIEVQPTRGTSQNLELLYTGKADLVTAQADVAAANLGMSSSTSNLQNIANGNYSARTVAILYQDLFQIVVRDNQINQFIQLKGKTIALQAKGGQYDSFIKLAEYFGLSKNDFRITGLDSSGKPREGYTDESADTDFIRNGADAVFRVRALGNKSISEFVQQSQGTLLAIEQAEAMKTKYPTFEAIKIPKGVYQGFPPVPANDLNTVGVARLLLASETVDKNVVQKITQIINENRQQIANAISEEDAEVKPLISSIRRPDLLDNANDSIGSTAISIHPGALAYYERDEPSFVQENADFLALILTIILLFVEWIRQLSKWIERKRKNEADEYIESAIKLMNESLGEVELRQDLLDEAFRTAAKALFDERISQESFRTFNEAYKTTRESIERERQLERLEIENKHLEVSAEYIKSVVNLLNNTQHNKDLLLEQLDKILEKVASDLVAENISQESFRTFVEAYKTTRDAIERRN
jgi:hypothetical protein